MVKAAEDVDIVGFVSNYVFPEGWPEIEDVPNHPNVVFTVGLHPHQCSSALITRRQLDFISSKLSNSLCRGLGEIGLDYNSHTSHRERVNQKDSLILLLQLLKDNSLPVVIHCRDSRDNREATEDCLEILGGCLQRSQVIHLHCFNGTASDVQRFRRQFPHCYFGISSLPLRARGDERPVMQQAVSSIPLDRVLLESDAPYLPLPGRMSMSDPNHPWTLTTVAHVAATWKGCSPGMLLHAAKINAQRIYGQFPEFQH